MATRRRKWLMSEIKRVRFLAEAELMSASQIAAEFGDGITRRQIGALCSRQGIKLDGDSGAPFGNTNRLGKAKPQSREERLAKQRKRMALHRLRVKATGGDPAKMRRIKLNYKSMRKVRRRRRKKAKKPD